MMQIFRSLDKWQYFRRKNLPKDKTIGFVATMGNLHAGHKSLLRRSRRENGVTVLSIYVNPTQFANDDDLKNYPRTIKADLKMAKEIGVDHVLLPRTKALYHDDYRYKMTESELSKKLCGKHRPDHFTGVLTVVLKLLQLVQPNRAYFGAKDYQQLQLVKGMVKAFFIDTKIIACPTIRDKEGLALSSRNSLLSDDQLILAKRFPKLLRSQNSCARIAQMLKNLGFKVEYIDEASDRRFAAVKLGKVRLIDNVGL